jgi:DNA modification methylase
MRIACHQTTHNSDDHDIYIEETNMTSIVSYPQRCNSWGNSRFRGNCDGRLFKNLVLRYRARRVADPMMGSGTTRDVIDGLNRTGRHQIHYWGADLRTGFDLQTDPLPGPFDLIWLHPPYWNIIRYSNDDPRDLSSCSSYERYCDSLRRCLRRCTEALSTGGRLAILVGDVRRRGVYFPIVRDVLTMEAELGQLRSIIIKAQHNCSSSAKTYRRLEDAPIQH